MKYLFLICCFALNTLSNNILANSTAAQSDDAIYAIQVAASNQPDLTRFKTIKRYGYLYTAYGNTSAQKILLGSFTTKTAAKTVLSKVKAKGYKDAFVTTIPMESQTMIYSVQFMSYAYSTQIDWEKFNYLGDVRIDATGGKVKLMTGSFYDKESARAHADMLSKEGYPGAFIRHINEGVLLYPDNNFISTPSLASSSEISTSSSVSTASTGGYSDPYNSKVYTSLSEFEKDLVVYLDGVLSIKHNGSIIPLTQYTPINEGSSYIESAPTSTATTTQPVYSEPVVQAAAPAATIAQPGVVYYGEGLTAKGVPAAVHTASPPATTQPEVIYYGEDMTPKAAPTTRVDYKVQITAVKIYDPLKFSSLNHMGTVDLENGDNGVNRVMLGTYMTEKDAKAALNEVKVGGFNQAYIVQYVNGSRGARIN